jgi:hypothetical protein
MDVAGVIVDRHRRRIAGAGIDATEVGRDDAPAAVSEAELPFPHPRIERKRVKEDDDAARPFSGGRRGFEISQTSDGRHPHIVNVPPPARRAR